jgi:glycosyltransferase involved in cell wall biosynthesis
MRVSIIVPAFNEEKLIGATLRRIGAASAAFSRRGWESEVIVCDNNSTDTTAAQAREAGATVVFEPANQIARARNTGAGAATGGWLVFVDADSRPSMELFDDVAGQIEGGRCVGGGSTMRLDERRFFTDCLMWHSNWFSRIIHWAAGAFVFCEKRAFDALGGFSLELYASEEIDFSRKLKKLARREGRKVVILHRHPLETSARKMRLYSRAELLAFTFRALFRPMRTVKSREACHPWYDGRR